MQANCPGNQFGDKKGSEGAYKACLQLCRESDDFQLGCCVYSGQEFVDATHYRVLDLVLGAALALEHRQFFENHDALVTDLERKVGLDGLQRGAADSALHRWPVFTRSV